MAEPELIVTAALTGLIWTVQLVHYPMFSRLSREDFTEAMIFHQNRIGYVVIPLMFAEVFLAVKRGSLVLLAPVVLIWLVTFTLMVPLHQKLLRERCPESMGRLVNRNWIRTFLWTARLLALAFTPSA